jgi:hypothetical protein
VNLYLHGLLHRKESEMASPGGAARSPHGAVALEEENRRLKILLANSMLEIAALKNTSHPG